MIESNSGHCVDVCRMGVYYALRTKDQLCRGRHRAFEKWSRGNGRAIREVKDRPQSLSRKERGRVSSCENKSAREALLWPTPQEHNQFLGGGYEILFRKLNVILGFVWDCEARHEWRQHNVVAKTREHFTFEDDRYSTLSGKTRLGMYLAKQLTELIETSSTRLEEHKAMHNVRDTFTVRLVLQEGTSNTNIAC